MKNEIATLPNITVLNATEKSINAINNRRYVRLSICEKSEADFSIEDSTLSNCPESDMVYLKDGGKFDGNGYFICEIIENYYELNFYKSSNGKVKKMCNMELQKIN